MVLSLGSSPALAASAATQVTQQVNGGAPPPPPPPPDPSPVPNPLPQLGNGPIVGAPFSSTVNVIAHLQITFLGTGALVTWTTSASSLTSLSWGSQSGADTGALKETLPRTEHSAYLARLVPATRYALDLNASSDQGLATYCGIVFTTVPQPLLVPAPVIRSEPSQPAPLLPLIPARPIVPAAQIATASSTPVDDICPNVPGVQSFVPLGLVRDQSGDCIPLTSNDRIVDHAHPLSAEPDTNHLITFAFVPSFLRIPVSLPIAASVIRFLTGGSSDTPLTHDPSPADPATPLDATGAVSLVVFCALILAAAIRWLAILVW